jgi:transposase-like protein
MNGGTAYPKTLVEAVKFFSDPDVSLKFFVSIRWPDGVTCPHCGSRNVSFLAAQRRWQCHTKHPRRQFSAKVGTIFEDSPLPLEKWMVAVWLEANAKNSISSYEVHRALGITQKSAWFMQQRIRLAMQSGEFTKLSGHVEVDESYIGGKARNMHKDRRAKTIKGTGGAGKAAVMGLLERHGAVRTHVVTTTKRQELQAIIRKNVEPGSHVSTDALKSYIGLDADYVHGVVDHAEQYVNGNVHTNGLENFWSLFKRCIKGTHVSVEPFHLFRYLDAETFRFNNRKVKDGQRFVSVMNGVTGKRLTYKSLIGKTPSEGFATSDSDEENEDLLN